MLSRKQTWRKIRSKSGETIFKFCDNGGIGEDGFSKLNDENPQKSRSSEDSVTLNGSKPIKKLRSAMSMGDLSKSLRRAEDIRNLRFSSKVHVCLIPTRQDLFSVAKEVFWATEDYQAFKREAVDELRAYLQLKGITAKEAIQALYQPQPEEFSLLRSLNVNKPSDSVSNGDGSCHNVLEASDQPSPKKSSASSSPPSIAVGSGEYNSSKMEIDEGEDSKDEIKLGFKTDLDMNKELGAMKTPAHQGGNAGAWAVQWQAPAPV